MGLTDFPQSGPDLGPAPRLVQAAAGAQAADPLSGDRRTAGFAALVRAADDRVAGTGDVDPAAPEARTGARPAIPTEVATRIADEAREEAVAALAFSLRSGDTLRTLIEAQVQKTIDAGLRGGVTAAPDADGPDGTERPDWRAPFG